MRIRVLGASGSEVRGHQCPAFAVNGVFLLDAGTVGASLPIPDENRIRCVLLTHAHFDHIKGVPFLLDNLVTRGMKHAVTIMSGRDVIDTLKTDVLNDRVWPDFTRIPTRDAPVLRYAVIRPGREETIEGHRVIAEKVSHTVPSYGYILEDGEGKAVAYTGDTGPTNLFWKRMDRRRPDCLIVETSFPNRLEESALRSGHLTPSLLDKELAKLADPPPAIFLVHGKPQLLPEIEREVRALGRKGIRFLKDGEILSI